MVTWPAAKENRHLPRFVVHEHHATRLHWDFRLEMDGVLKSWAVPKGPSEEPGVKRLAVAVDDHPLDYIDFHGVIEEGYGAGTVEIWDAGTYELSRREEKFLEFRLSGGRLTGRYKMIFTGYGGGKGWLLVKGTDRPVLSGPPPAAVEAEKKASKKTKRKTTKKAKKRTRKKRKSRAAGKAGSAPARKSKPRR
ncbi:MAG: DNA polymerase ligase N-terminal domain-containing protein [Planctomycetota bacterium]|jgi:bifunctional non-homologous end joining protein LigD